MTEAPRDPKAPKQAQPPVEAVLGAQDDLFDFDELIDPTQAVADLAAHEPTRPYEELNGPAMAAMLDAQSAPSDPRAPREPRAPLPTERVAPTAPPMEVPQAQPPAAAWGAPPERLTLPRLIAVIVSIGFLLYLPLAYITWHSVGTLEESTRQIGDRLALTADELLRSRTPVPGREPSPAIQGTSEGEEALVRAQKQIDRGDFEGARQRIYALLAVVDRVPVESRADIEARASFLLAETFRAQAEGSESPVSPRGDDEPRDGEEHGER